ncbi:MAG: AI-2E family transporter, partial [Bradymonadaceae bacterium]
MGEQTPSETGGPPAQPSGEASEDGVWYWSPGWFKTYVFPGLTLVLVLALLFYFHEAVLPFVFACLIVYLMEPVVQRMARASPTDDGLPRWLAVIFVYLAFFGIVTVAGIVVIPRFVSELVRFGKTAPRQIQQFHAEKLPGFNRKLQSYLDSFFPGESTENAVERATKRVAESRRRAVDRSQVFGAAMVGVRRAASLERTWSRRSDGVRRRVWRVASSHRVPDPSADGEAVHGRWRRVRRERSPAFRIVERESSGAYDIYLAQRNVELRRIDSGRWRLSPVEPERRDERRTPNTTPCN